MSRRIKLLFTTSNFNTAGSGKVIYDLIKGLDKSKFEIEIACGNDKGEFFKEIQTLEVPIHIFNTKTSYRPYLSLLKRIIQISRFYRKHKYDLIHSWQWSSDWTEALAARFAGVKWIYTKKAMGFDNKHWKIKSYLANHIVTINDEMQLYFPKKQRKTLIPLGIDTNYYSPEHFGDLTHRTDSSFRIITVANLVPVKGVELLIKAINELNDPELQLTILGDDENVYGHSLKKMVRDLNLDQQIQFLGKKLDVRLDLYNSDLYIIPTLNQGRKEGMPMALVEAMSMELPVLGSNVSGINFVLKDFQQLLFEAGDVKSLAEKIKMIRGMPLEETLELKHVLRKYCIKNFSIRTFIERHEDLYFNIVKS